VPKLIRQEGNRNRPVVIVEEPTNNGSTATVNENNTSANSNSNSKAENTNSNSETDSSAAAPTDADEVLATLTSLEHDWTAANINADKQALDRILADDYVGTTPDGKSIGKAEYIRTIERDTTTQKWNFEDLTISLRGNRASLTGVVRFQTQGREAAFRFTDKFVWRDGRWQATGSEISQL
jgi:ketosteroid isomerase-like protein